MSKKFLSLSSIKNMLKIFGFSITLISLSACGGGSDTSSNQAVKHKIDGTSYAFNGTASASLGTMIQGKNGASIKNYGTISQDDSASPIPILNSLKPSNSNAAQADALMPLSLDADLPNKIFKAIDISGKSDSHNYGTINLTGKDFIPKATDNKPCLTGMIADGYSNATNEASGTISLSSKISMDANITTKDDKDMLKPWPAAMYANDHSTITNKGDISDTAQFDSSMLVSDYSSATNNGTISLNEYASKHFMTFLNNTRTAPIDGMSGIHIAMTAFNHSTLVNNGAFSMQNTKGTFLNAYQVPYKFMFATDYSTLTNNKDITIKGIAGQKANKELEVFSATYNSKIINKGKITVSGVSYTGDSNSNNHISLLELESNSSLENTGILTINDSHIQYGSILAIEIDSSPSTQIINNANITITNSSATPDSNDSDTGYVEGIQIDNSKITNTGDITFSSISGGSKQNARLIEVQGNSTVTNKGNLNINASSGVIGVKLDKPTVKLDNGGKTITISADSSNSCGIFASSQSQITNMGTIQIGTQKYTDLATAWSAPAVGTNKAICHK